MTEEVSTVTEVKKKKNPKPLVILVHPTLLGTEEVQELLRKGHTVVGMDDPPEEILPCHEYDLILGPNCWRMDSRLIGHLDECVKSQRAIKFPKKERENDL